MSSMSFFVWGFSRSLLNGLTENDVFLFDFLVFFGCDVKNKNTGGAPFIDRKREVANLQRNKWSKFWENLQTLGMFRKLGVFQSQLASVRRCFHIREEGCFFFTGN